MMRIAAMASHGGSILQAVLDACHSGELAAEVVLVISNNSDARALQRARSAGIATLHLSGRTHADPDALDNAITDALQQAGADWLLLAGYMKKLGPNTLNAYRNRILNTHPALLPKFGGQGFYGRKVHEAVLAAGEHESGATVHLVDETYDSGPILAQVRVPIRNNESAASLEERVKVAERKLLLATLTLLAEPKQAAGY
jgi:phosphoribosylglycinamide formyltransferase-1